MIRLRSKGLSGIGSLIIFIAVLLVASTTAVVILFTASELQQRALGTDTVGGSISVMSVMGTDGGVGNDIEHFEIMIRLGPGSDPIKLNRTIITFDTPTTTQSLSYNWTAGDTTNLAAGTSDYTVEWVKRDSDHEVGILKYGEYIWIRFNHHDVGPSDTSGGVGENKKLTIMILPHDAYPAQVSLITPTPINEMRQPLWPRDALM